MVSASNGASSKKMRFPVVDQQLRLRLERRHLQRIGKRSRRQCQSLRSGCAIIDRHLLSRSGNHAAIQPLPYLVDERIGLGCGDVLAIATPGNSHTASIGIGGRFELTSSEKEAIITRRNLVRAIARPADALGVGEPAFRQQRMRERSSAHRATRA